MSDTTTKKIAKLNDLCRTAMGVAGKLFQTAGMCALPHRTREGLWNRIGELLDRFTPTECANYCKAAGYGDSF